MTQTQSTPARVEYMHFRSIFRNGVGGATVAIMPQEERGTALISVSRCGPMDNFNKKIGRDIAVGRLTAYLAGRSSAAVHIREIDVPDMLRLKESVAVAMAPELDDIGLA